MIEFGAKAGKLPKQGKGSPRTGRQGTCPPFCPRKKLRVSCRTGCLVLRQLGKESRPGCVCQRHGLPLCTIVEGLVTELRPQGQERAITGIAFQDYYRSTYGRPASGWGRLIAVKAEGTTSRCLTRSRGLALLTDVGGRRNVQENPGGTRDEASWTTCNQGFECHGLVRGRHPWPNGTDIGGYAGLPGPRDTCACVQEGSSSSDAGSTRNPKPIHSMTLGYNRQQ
jgi:hypothetical protein